MFSSAVNAMNNVTLRVFLMLTNKKDIENLELQRNIKLIPELLRTL